MKYTIYEKALLDTYTGKHFSYDKDEGLVLSKSTKSYTAQATCMNGDEHDTGLWDIWIVAKSERKLSAILARLEPVGLEWTRLDEEAWVRCNLFTLCEVFDRLSVRRRAPIYGVDRLKRTRNLKAAKAAKLTCQ